MAGQPEFLDVTESITPILKAGLAMMPDLPLPEDLPPEPVAISEMANLFGVTHRTLHFYEEKNLLSSSRMGLMRVYYHRDIIRMALINTCREIGMPIAAIQDLFAELSGTITQAQANELLNTALEARKRELIASQSMMFRQIEQINNLLTREEDQGETEMPTLRHGIDLTELEHHCLSLMAEGYTQVRVARTMQMTFEAVIALEASIMRKVQATNRFQAVAKAVLLGIVAN
ncbi:MerR family transcriptional regulator [Agrobacterium vitis]|uniref:MerR family transcriptional regulator n=1 Tax=Agrobacterium vitis TaxID=373 RepID=UPI0012E8D84E|nr:MerR family transcriptional regulator [Agrobacterium vitis]MVA61584.1 MerR family transcriptional regulator [Agrobacterium vitis]